MADYHHIIITGTRVADSNLALLYAQAKRSVFLPERGDSQPARRIYRKPVSLLRSDSTPLLSGQLPHPKSLSLLCQPEVLKRWRYPASGFAVTYRFA